MSKYIIVVDKQNDLPKGIQFHIPFNNSAEKQIQEGSIRNKYKKNQMFYI